MKLSEKIMTLRKKAGWSQEELAMRLDVSRQAVSKWEAEQSVPDLDKILGMSELFGVSTDSLLKDSEPIPQSGGSGTEYGAAHSNTDDIPPDGRFPKGSGKTPADWYGTNSKSNDSPSDTAPYEVNREEAEAFLTAKIKAAGRIAIGTLLCVLSPICLITLAVLADGGRMSENLAAVVGIAVLLVFVSVAVVLFLSGSALTESFDWVARPFTLQPGARETIRSGRDAYRSCHTLLLIVGTLLCILAVIPLLVSVLIPEEQELYVIFGLDLLLVLVSVGVCFFIRTGGRWETYQVLLGEENSGRREKVCRNAVSAIYWPLVTAGFLAYSFITSDWGRSWIVWPVAGVLYGAIVAIVELVSRSREKPEN